MLAQGQSSSAKWGGLVAVVSSGLIFLKNKKKRKIPTGLLSKTPEIFLFYFVLSKSKEVFSRKQPKSILFLQSPIPVKLIQWKLINLETF